MKAKIVVILVLCILVALFDAHFFSFPFWLTLGTLLVVQIVFELILRAFREVKARLYEMEDQLTVEPPKYQTPRPEPPKYGRLG